MKNCWTQTHTKSICNIFVLISYWGINMNWSKWLVLQCHLGHVLRIWLMPIVNEHLSPISWKKYIEVSL